MGEFNEMPVRNDDLNSLVDSDSEKERFGLDFNGEVGMNNPPLCKGMKLSNGHIFKKALREWAIKRGYSYILTKSNRLIITVMGS